MNGNTKDPADCKKEQSDEDDDGGVSAKIVTKLVV